MKKLDLNKTLRTILLVLAIVLMFIKLMGKAKADSISDSIVSVYDVLDLFQSDLSSSDYQTLIEYVQQYDNCCLLFNAQEHSFLLNCTNESGAFGAVQSVNFSPVRISGTFLITNGSSTGTVLTAYYNNTGGLYLYTRTGTGSLYGNVIGNTDYKVYYFTTNYIKVNDNFTFSLPFANTYHFYTEGFSDVVYQSGSYYTAVNTQSSYVDNKVVTMDRNQYTDTGFFNIWTSISQNDNKMLNITWDSSVFPSSGSMNYVKSVMDLTIEVNGTAQVVSFDSDDNPELFPTSSGTYIPYKFLQKVADLAEVSPSDSFYLTMVSLTQYAYPAGAPSSSATAYNETSLCSVDLGEIQVDVPTVTPVADIPISETNIVDTTFFTNIVGGSVSPAIDYPVPVWANHIQVAVGENPSAPYDLYLSWGYLEEISTQILSMDFSFGSGSSLVGASAELVTEYFKNLDYGALFQKLSQDYLLDYADIVTFDCYNLDSSNNAYIVKRIVIYTDSYFYKMQLQSLGSIQDMIQANTYYTKALYDYAIVRLDGMAQSLEKLRISNNSLLGSINANIINLQGLISSGTDRIVSALQGISGGGLSVSDLSGTLNTLFMPSFEWDAVNYQDYLDSLGVLALPFEFVFDTQSIIKNNYSSTIVLPINDFSVPLGKDFNDNDIQFTVFEDQENFEYDPTDIFPAAIWPVFQYLAAFGLVIGEAWFTYVHIFRKEEKSGDF